MAIAGVFDHLLNKPISVGAIAKGSMFSGLRFGAVGSALIVGG